MHELLDLLQTLPLKDPEHVGAALGGPQGHQGAGLLELLQPGQVLLAEGGAFLKGVVAVGAPEHEAHGDQCRCASAG